MKHIYYPILTVMLTLAIGGCTTTGLKHSDKGSVTNDDSHYSISDFYKVDKIDAHVHANSSDTAFIEQAQQDNIRLLSINVDYPDFPPIDQQYDTALKLASKDAENFMFAATFSMNEWSSPTWQDDVITRIDGAVENGAVAVKVWKNIGMNFRAKDDRLVMIDNAKFDPIFGHLKAIDIPLIGHQGEPKNCWLPLDEMTVNNDRQYFAAHPQYHMYLHPEFPTYEDQMDARNTMLEKNSGLPFMGAHMASLEWSVDELAAFLERFPLAVADMAARMGQVQHQSQLDRDKVRKFFIDYQDRILYATDLTHGDASERLVFQKQAHQKWLNDWTYLNTKQSVTVPEVNGSVTGLALPKSVADKIFRLNAERFFKASK